MPSINHNTLRPCKHASLYADTCIRCKLSRERAEATKHWPRDVLGHWMGICREEAKR
jgi:hypothetical protein